MEDLMLNQEEKSEKCKLKKSRSFQIKSENYKYRNIIWKVAVIINKKLVNYKKHFYLKQ